jgi:hypothetical protein
MTVHDGIFILDTISAVAMVSAMVAAVAALLAPSHHATLQHSNNATLVTRAFIATTKTMQMVGYCAFTYLLTYDCLMCCPYLHKLMLPPTPQKQRGHKLPSSGQKNQRENQCESFTSGGSSTV